MLIKANNIKYFLKEYLKIYKNDNYIISNIDHLAKFLERKLWHLLVKYKNVKEDEEIELITDTIIERLRKIK